MKPKPKLEQWRVVRRDIIPDTFTLFAGGHGGQTHNYFAVHERVLEQRGDELRSTDQSGEPLYQHDMSYAEAALFDAAAAAVRVLGMAALRVKACSDGKQRRTRS